MSDAYRRIDPWQCIREAIEKTAIVNGGLVGFAETRYEDVVTGFVFVFGNATQLRLDMQAYATVRDFEHFGRELIDEPRMDEIRQSLAAESVFPKPAGNA